MIEVKIGDIVVYEQLDGRFKKPTARETIAQVEDVSYEFDGRINSVRTRIFVRDLKKDKGAYWIEQYKEHNIYPKITRNITNEERNIKLVEGL